MANINFIWDADGTLIDSYDSILYQVSQACDKYGVNYDKEFIREMIQQESVSYFFRFLNEKHGINFDDLIHFHNYEANIDLSLIKPMDGVVEVLEKSKEYGVSNFIYTHRAGTINDVVKRLDLEKYFTEIVNLENGFKRKPDGEAVEYLVDKYHMDKNHTYYLGDRLLDQQCARSAGVKAVFFHSYKKLILDEKDYDYKIEELNEVFDILK